MRGENKIGQFCLDRNISLDETVSSLVIVIRQSSKQVVLQEAQKESADDNYLSLRKQGTVFWMFKLCKGEDELELQQIQRLVGLSATTICLDLPNSLQTWIEKTFSKVQNEVFSEAKGTKLMFIKGIYRDKQSVSNTKYFDSFEKAKNYVLKNNHQVISPIQVSDLLQIYDTDVPKNVSKVKAIYEEYQQIRNREDAREKANQMIFDSSRSKGLIQSQMEELGLSKQFGGKLSWKLEQIHRYRSWVEQGEDKVVRSKLSKLTCNDLDDSLDYRAVLKHQKEWIKNSLSHLKKSFSKINNSEDKLNIQNFQKEYKTMKRHLENLMQGEVGLPARTIFSNMLQELAQFHQYHSQVIQGRPLSSLGFIKGEAQYLWKHHNNFYKKMAVFFMLGGLGYLQKDYIWGLTLLILAILTLTLRC